MTETIIIALPRFLKQARSIADFLGADVHEYSPEIFSEIFRHKQRIVAIMSMGIVVWIADEQRRLGK